jgi:hypothetical protein
LIDGGDERTDGSDDNTIVVAFVPMTPHGNGDPPPAFATTSSETIDFSIGFGFAALIYISL